MTGAMGAAGATGFEDALRTMLAESESREEASRASLVGSDLDELHRIAGDFPWSGGEPPADVSRAELLCEVIGVSIPGDLGRALSFANVLAGMLPPPGDDVASAAVAGVARSFGVRHAPVELMRWVVERSPLHAPTDEDRDPAALAARISASFHVANACVGDGEGPAGLRPRPARAGVEALLRAQDRDGGWTGADGRDVTARVLDDALAIALLAEPANPAEVPAVAVSVARALAHLAGTQGEAGDWRGDLPGTIAILRAALLLWPVVEERFPGALVAFEGPERSRRGRFLERGFAWCLSRKPDVGWAAACPADADPEAALRLCTAGVGLLLEYGAWRSGGPLGPAQRRGLA